MTPEQRTLLSEALRDLDVLRVDTPQIELLTRARTFIAAALETDPTEQYARRGLPPADRFYREAEPVRLNDLSDTWPDFVEGDL